MDDWDPIGVKGIPESQDEYDSYVLKVCDLIMRREPLQELSDFLWSVETEWMMLTGDRRRTDVVARRLFELPENIDG
jgi:hypothetical protein